MIVAERKPFEQIWDSIKGSKSVLVLGCGTCVAVCQAGGEKEVSLMASELRMKGRLEGKEITKSLLYGAVSKALITKKIKILLKRSF